jgi:hypothetical protein
MPKGFKLIGIVCEMSQSTVIAIVCEMSQGLKLKDIVCEMF